MPVKGAKGLVIVVVILTGQLYPCLIGYFFNFFGQLLAIDDTASIIFPTRNPYKNEPWFL